MALYPIDPFFYECDADTLPPDFDKYMSVTPPLMNWEDQGFTIKYGGPSFYSGLSFPFINGPNPATVAGYSCWYEVFFPEETEIEFVGIWGLWNTNYNVSFEIYGQTPEKQYKFLDGAYNLRDNMHKQPLTWFSFSKEKFLSIKINCPGAINPSWVSVCPTIICIKQKSFNVLIKDSSKLKYFGGIWKSLE